MSDIVSVVSGGPSASHVDLATVPGFVVGVNNAALHMPRIDGAISMDRRWAQAHWPWFVEKNGAVELWLRPNNVLRIPERPAWLHVYRNDYKQHRMSDEPNTLNGTNSGGVALNLAYSMRPKTVFLFGFDYCQGPKRQNHWFADGETGRVGDYPIAEPRYRGWAAQFNDVGPQFKARGIEVLNVSSFSIVNAFKKITPKDFARLSA